MEEVDTEIHFGGDGGPCGGDVPNQFHSAQWSSAGCAADRAGYCLRGIRVFLCASFPLITVCFSIPFPLVVFSLSPLSLSFSLSLSPSLSLSSLSCLLAVLTSNKQAYIYHPPLSASDEW